MRKQKLILIAIFFIKWIIIAGILLIALSIWFVTAIAKHVEKKQAKQTAKNAYVTKNGDDYIFLNTKLQKHDFIDKEGDYVFVLRDKANTKGLELDEKSVVKDYLTTASDGKNYNVTYYALPMVIAVGFRVRSIRGTQFRRWANENLSEYLTKGFILDDERLKNPDGRPDYFDELKELNIECDSEEILNELAQTEEKKKYYNTMNEQYMDLTSMLIEAKMSFNLSEAHNFINPYCQIGFEKNKGIKVYAKRPILLGEMIAKCKAFAAIQATTNNYSPHEPGSNINLNNLVKEKLATASEESKKELFTLYNGKNILLNLKERTEVCQADLESQISSLIKFNSKSTLFCFSDHYQVARGIWVFPSYFNHSCDPNVYVFGLGDYMILMPARDIDQNEELTLSYVDYLVDSDTKRKVLKSIFGFDCQCQKCKNEAKRCEQSSTYKEGLKTYIDYHKKLNSIIKSGAELDNDENGRIEAFIMVNLPRFSDNEVGLIHLLLAKYYKNKGDLTKSKSYAKFVMDGFPQKRDSYLSFSHLILINSISLMVGEGCQFVKSCFLNFDMLHNYIEDIAKEDPNIFI